jgi:uncharacterized protein YbjT (DUF2867 family)
MFAQTVRTKLRSATWASLLEAAKGVEGVFHINPAFALNEADLGVSMVQAAEQASVRKFVFSGVIHPSISKMINHAAQASSRRGAIRIRHDFHNLAAGDVYVNIVERLERS